MLRTERVLGLFGLTEFSVKDLREICTHAGLADGVLLTVDTLMTPALFVMLKTHPFDCQMVPMGWWKCITMAHGEQFATTVGALLMAMWYVVNWDMLEL
jgi:hypothetical protein